MKEIYSDRKAVSDLLAKGEDRIIYEFRSVQISEQKGHLQYGLCTIYPGKIGQEYHMTKGHFHLPKDTAEIYIGLKGGGYLIMQTEENKFSSMKMVPGAIAYIPPCWAHRVINTGVEELMFFAVCPGNISHDYDVFRRKGFAKLVIEGDGKPTFIHNARYK